MQNRLSEPEDLMLQNATPLRISARTVTSLMNMSLVIHLWRSPSNVPRLPSVLEMPQNLHVLPICENMQNPLRLPRKTKSERPKMLRTRQFVTLLIAKRASRHNGVHFFRHQLPKVVRGWCVLYILTWKCALPQRRALFHRLNFQKLSEPGVLCAFWLRNLLRATTACTFSTSKIPKMVRRWCVLYILT